MWGVKVAIVFTACYLSLQNVVLARQLAPRVFCPPKFVQVGNHCYYFTEELVGKWDESWNFCREEDQHASLATFTSRKQWDAVKTYMKEQAFPKTQRWWIGGSNKMTPDMTHWDWIPISKPFYFNAWCSGKPTSTLPGPLCTELVNAGSDICWMDVPCEDIAVARHIVCEATP